MNRLYASAQRLAFALVATAAATLAFSSNASAQGTGTVTGRVLNQATGQYLRNAVVTVVGTNINALSEAGGNYTLLGVPAGTARISVYYAGLDTREETVTVSAGQTANLDFNLTSQDYDPEVITMGEFVVAAEREGNARAITEQRESLNYKTVIAADAFGDVSEGNIGEFLKLMPGISIDYVEADVRSMSLGGLDPKYATIMMDGAAVASAGSSDINTGRVFEFEQLSVASIETIEVNRTPTPDVSGSAVAGVVNLRSKGAFDRQGRRISYLLTMSANSLDLDLKKTPGPGGDRTYKIQPNLQLEYSDVILGGKLGVLAGFNYSWSFAEQKALTFNYAMDNNPENNDTEIPRVTSLSLRDSPKPTERKNFNLRLDYKFSNELSAWGRIDYNTYSGQFFSRDLNFTFSPGNTSASNPVINAPDPDGAGVQRAGPVDPAVEYSLNSQTTTSGNASINQGGGSTNKHGSTRTWSGGLFYRRGAFTADVSGQFSLSTNEYKDAGSGWFWSVNPGNAPGSFRFDRPDPSSVALDITQLSGANWRDLSSYPNGFTVTTNDRASEDQQWTGKADFRYSFVETPVPIQLKWGLNYRASVREIQRRRGNSLTHLGADGVANTADDSPALYQDEYFMSWPWGGNLDDVPSHDRHALAAEHKAHPDWFTSLNPVSLLQQDLQQYRKTKEQIDALYVQPTFKLGKFDVAPGYRWEHTRGRFFGPSAMTDLQTRTALGLTATPNPITAEYVMTRYGTLRRDQFTDYDTSLKYLHLTYRHTRDLVFRASYNDSITRPDLNRLTAGITINNDLDIPPRASVGNPDLRPERGRNLYLSAEYYFAEQVGSFTISVARRDIRDLIRTVTVEIPPDGSFDDDPAWAGWEISTAENVDKAHNTSVELSYQQTLDFLPGIWRNLGVFANHTRLYYDDYDNFRRPQRLANAGVTFRYKDVTFSWRSNYTSAYRDQTVQNNGWMNHIDTRLFHDIQINYNLRRNVTLSLTGRNIFEEPTRTYWGSGDRQILRRHFEAGSFWTLGVKGNF